MPDGTDVEFTAPLDGPLAYLVNTRIAGSLTDEIHRVRQTPLAIHEIVADETEDG
jgi:hypothetical protein